MGVWHYTVAEYLPDILESGQIICATAFLPKGIKPVVWFSTNSIWEETANKSYVDKNGIRHSGNKKTTAKLGQGLVRIEVTPNAAPHSWEDYKKKNREHKKEMKGLEKVALNCSSNPSEWRVSFHPVPKEKWIAVEIWNWKKQIWENFNEVIDMLDAGETEKRDFTG